MGVKKTGIYQIIIFVCNLVSFPNQPHLMFFSYFPVFQITSATLWDPINEIIGNRELSSTYQTIFVNDFNSSVGNKLPTSKASLSVNWFIELNLSSTSFSSGFPNSTSGTKCRCKYSVT